MSENKIKVTICGPNLNDQSKGTFHVHAAGCADLVRGARREPEYTRGWTVEAASYKEVAMDIYPPGDFEYDSEDPSEMSMYVQDLYFFPCCSALAAE